LFFWTSASLGEQHIAWGWTLWDQLAYSFGQNREALKYQLYRECLRELHPDVDQFRWYELLNLAFQERPESTTRILQASSQSNAP
jgi:hypothetical protein